ncbi:MAG: hypothetical protein AAGE94_10730 [Acidobacteriota bacterium]
MTEPFPPTDDSRTADALPAELRRRLDELPRAIEPERDLWPAIADRLQAPVPNETHPRHRVARGSIHRDRFRRALAAALYMGLGALVTWVAMTSRVADSARSGNAVIEVVPASFQTGVGPDGLAAIEADFFRAREALWLDVLARRDRLQPSTVAVVEQNLAIIDRAIRDLRKALDADPGNPSLERRLIDSHRRSLDLLRRLTREV